MALSASCLGQCRFEFDVSNTSPSVQGFVRQLSAARAVVVDRKRWCCLSSDGWQAATEEDVSGLLLPFGEREVFSITGW